MTIACVARSLSVVAALACCGMAHAASYQFSPLGQSFGQNVGLGLSSDGRQVVGVTFNSDQFHWSQATGFQVIPEIAGGGSGGSLPSAVSNTGRVTGFSNGSGSTQAYSWSAADGTQGLGFFPSVIGEFSEGTAISDDGSVIAGTGLDDSGNRSFRYTNSLQSLGSLPGAAFSGNYAYAISGDGQTVAGRASSTAGNDVAYVWTSATGMVGLGTPSGYDSSFAVAMSPDAQYIAGTAFNSGTGDAGAAFVFANGVFSTITSPLGDVNVDDVSNTGVAVGSVSVGESSFGFVWTAADGLVDLSTFLAGTPAAAGWSFRGATGISADGSTILVVGTNANGEYETALVTVPAPSAGVLGLVGLAAMGRRRR